MASIFSGIERAEVFGKNAKIRPGYHRLRIDEVLVKKSAKAAKWWFIVEATVISSTGGRPMTAKELPAGTKAPLSDPHQPGEKVSWLCDVGNANFLSNVKGFAIALAPDLEDADVTEASCEALVNQDPARGPVQPCAGILVDCDAFAVVTKEKGNDFTAVRWIPVASA